MSMTTSGSGILSVVIWPAYVGACQEDPGASPIPYGEPEGTQYRRGQIQWGMADGDIVGRAYIHAEAGVYTHLAYFRGPEGPCMCGKVQLPHPIRFLRAGVIEVYPITNAELELSKVHGCP